MLRPTPSRASQPYRARQGRPPGAALDAMLRGGPAYLPNPISTWRGTMRQRKRRTLADRMLG